MKKIIQIVIILFAVGLNSFAQNVDLQKGLVAYYPFSGNANDESGNGNNGTVYGASLTNDRNGKSNSAYSFDGNNDYIDLGYGIQPDKFTLSAWIYIEKSSAYQTIITKLENVSQDYYKNFELRINSNNKLFCCIPSGNRAWESFESQKLVNTHVWTFVTITYDGSTAKMYINGYKNASFYGKYAYSNTKTVIGCRKVQHQNFFNGKIDNIRIYNRAINEAEIQALYGKESTVVRNNTSFVNKTTATNSNDNQINSNSKLPKETIYDKSPNQKIESGNYGHIKRQVFNQYIDYNRDFEIELDITINSKCNDCSCLFYTDFDEKKILD